jgi:tight adherence protein C
LNEFSRRMYQDREEGLEEKAAKTSAKMALVIMPFMFAPYLILLLGEKMVLLGRGF